MISFTYQSKQSCVLDIFIFMDAYRQSAIQNGKVLESLESRMSWVYRRTGSAMAITSGELPFGDKL